MWVDDGSECFVVSRVAGWTGGSSPCQIFVSAVVQAAYIPREIFRVHRFRYANTHVTRTIRQEAAKTMDSILTGS